MRSRRSEPRSSILSTRGARSSNCFRSISDCGGSRPGSAANRFRRSRHGRSRCRYDDLVRSSAAGRIPKNWPAASSLLLDQRALTLAERPRGFFRRDRRDELVVIPRIFRFLRLLHLKQVGGQQLAAVDADGALAEQRIVGRQLLHLGDDLGAVMRIASHRLKGLEIVQHARVEPRNLHRRHVPGLRLRRQPLRPCARLVVHVPVEGFCEGQALRGFQPQRVHVVDEERSAASFWPPATMPNSAACLIALVVSPPALASPITFAFEDCACSRNDEKSEVLSGCLTPPSTLPPLAVTVAAVSRSSAWPNA